MKSNFITIVLAGVLFLSFTVVADARGGGGYQGGRGKANTCSWARGNSQAINGQAKFNRKAWNRDQYQRQNRSYNQSSGNGLSSPGIGRRDGIGPQFWNK